jgi:4-amino-4-deoxy-L-arabinose transferase-like glycosyltransferase
MTQLTHRRTLAALALAAVLALPWPAAAAPQARYQPAAPGFLQQLWTALTAFWEAGVPPDSGCKMDPDGGCLPRSAAPAPAITPDSGCKMDPNGGCLPGS